MFESPVLEYAAPIRGLHARQGISQEQFVAMWSVCDAFLTGFMVMLAQAATRARVQTDRPVIPKQDGSRVGVDGAALADDLTRALSEEVFAQSLEVVIAGLRMTVLAS